MECVKKNVEDHNNMQCTYDLILMDCNMPVMDGLETTSKIREYLYEKQVEQPIISAVTGHFEQIYVNQAIGSGMNQVISKPVDLQCLSILVRRLGF